jgi:hypothetical protein
MQNSNLIQAVVGEDLKEWVEKQAASEYLSVSSFLRRLVAAQRDKERVLESANVADEMLP